MVPFGLTLALVLIAVYISIFHEVRASNLYHYTPCMPLRQKALLFLEGQACAINTIPLTGRFRAIGENVAQMPAAPTAGYLNPMHPVGVVFVELDSILVFGIV